MNILTRLLDFIKSRNKIPNAEKAEMEKFISQLLVEEKIQTLSKHQKSLEAWAKEIYKMIKNHPEIDEETAINYILYTFGCILNKENKC